jgi:hypothetical protein
LFSFVIVINGFLSGDPKEIESALKGLQNANDVLLMCGREEQNNKVDPHRRRDLSNALDELERLLPLQVKAAKEAKEKPRDAAAKKAVLEINGLVGNAVDDVVRKAVPAPKDRAASALASGLDELDRLLEAIKREDPARAALSIRGIGACFFFIIYLFIIFININITDTCVQLRPA